MKILYDHQAFTYQYYGGVSKCFCELISHLPATALPIIGVSESNNIHLHNSNLCANLKPVSIDEQHFMTRYSFRGKGKLYKLLKLFNFNTTEIINKKKCLDLLKSGDFDIFHPTFFDDYYLEFLNGKPFVLTIHDMMPELFPQYYKKNDIQIIGKKKLVTKASVIIAVSEQTKKDIIEILNVPEEKIHVIYHGGPKVENFKGKGLYDFPYFLYVGQRGTYKNFPRLLQDFSKFIKIYSNVKLVCTGPDFTSAEYDMIKLLKLEKNIIHRKSSDQDLKLLYANAIAFVYPSLYEGFGMPILEAFAYGCPVLLNNKSCFPEIAGDAAIYFEADNDSSNLLEVMNHFYNLPDKHINAIVNNGYRRLSDFSWEKSAEKLYDIYKYILE